MVRENNEDRFLIFQEGQLSVFAVADGMGGHAAGEVASTLALETVTQYLTAHREKLQRSAAEGRSLEQPLAEMLTAANSSVLLAGDRKSECNGMGTTLTLLLSVSGQAWIGHIGDSRAYLLRQGQLDVLTEDHTLVTQLARSGQIREEEMENHPQRHILTQALGTDNEPKFDLRQCFLQAGDQILLCTDGLYGLVDEREMRQEMETEHPAAMILERLVALANERGGTDNITAVLVYIP